VLLFACFVCFLIIVSEFVIHWNQVPACRQQLVQLNSLLTMSQKNGKVRSRSRSVEDF